MFETLGHLPAGWLFFTVLTVVGCVAFFMGRTALSASLPTGTVSVRQLHSQPNYHGYFVAMMTLLPAAFVIALYAVMGEWLVRIQILSELPAYITDKPELEVTYYLDQLAEHAALRDPPATGNMLFDAASARFAALKGQYRLVGVAVALLAGIGGYFVSRRRIRPDFRARVHVERGINLLLFVCAGIAVLTTLGIIMSLVIETAIFLTMPGGSDLFGFLFGLEWNAQTGEDFGAVPLFFGTLMIALLAMLVAVPIGIFSAIYLSEYASQELRSWAKPLLELLAGIPTVVYGFFAALVIAPLVRNAAQWINGLPLVPDNLLAAQPQSALAAGLVMGIMIIPFVSSLSDDVINAVPQTLRDGSLAMGATRSETIRQVVLPAALPGVIASVLLAVSRAIGETMIVVMAAGQRAQITADPTSDLTTITVQIVALLTGDTEFDNAKTLSAFALGFVLFLVTLGFNLIALSVVRRYREKYD